MLALDPGALAACSTCAVVARSSAVGPELLLGANNGSTLLAARWRRRRVRLAEPVALNHHVLSYCVAGSGAGTIVAGGSRIDYLQQAGALTFVPAGVPVQWSLDADADVVHIHVYLGKGAFAGVVRDRAPREAVRPQSFVTSRDPWFDSYFRLLLSEYELYGGSGRLGESLFLDQTEQILASRLLIRSPICAGIAGRHSAPRQVSPLRPTVLGRVIEYLLQNMSSEIRLARLAELAGVSVDHFVRAFRGATGTTPHRYLLELRLNRARDLLGQGSAPVAQVAQECGFSGPAHFSAAFHARFGLTPSQYRRSQ